MSYQQRLSKSSLGDNWVKTRRRWGCKPCGYVGKEHSGRANSKYKGLQAGVPGIFKQLEEISEAGREHGADMSGGEDHVRLCLCGFYPHHQPSCGTEHRSLRINPIPKPYKDIWILLKLSWRGGRVTTPQKLHIFSSGCLSLPRHNPIPPSHHAPATLSPSHLSLTQSNFTCGLFSFHSPLIIIYIIHYTNHYTYPFQIFFLFWKM